MIKCSVRYSKARVAFKDLHAGSVFRTEEGNDYIFLKIDDINVDETAATAVILNAVKISSGALFSFNPEELVEELYNVELLYDTIH